MTSFLDRVIFNASSGSTGPFIQGSSVTGYQLMGPAGAVSGQAYRYAAQSNDLTQWEYGNTVWTSSNSQLTRTPLGNSLGSTALINFTNPPQVMITMLAEDATEVFEPAGGDLAFWVSSTGNDLNPGSSLLTFLNPQRAADVAATFDYQHQWVVTINLADSTYNLSAPITVQPLRNPPTGRTNVIQGNTGSTATFGNVALTLNGNDPLIFVSTPLSNWAVLGMQINSNTGAGVLAYNQNNVSVDDIIFNVGDSAIQAVGPGTIVQCIPYDQGKTAVIRATSRAFAKALQGGECDLQNTQVTFLNSPNFTAAFFQCLGGGIGTLSNITYVNKGTVTGLQADFERSAQFNGDWTTLPGSGLQADNSALYDPVLFSGTFYPLVQPATRILTTADIPTGCFVIQKDSGGGGKYLMTNDGGSAIILGSQDLALPLHANLGGL